MGPETVSHRYTFLAAAAALKTTPEVCMEHFSVNLIPDSRVSFLYVALAFSQVDSDPSLLPFFCTQMACANLSMLSVPSRTQILLQIGTPDFQILTATDKWFPNILYLNLLCSMLNVLLPHS